MFHDEHDSQNRRRRRPTIVVEYEGVPMSLRELSQRTGTFSKEFESLAGKRFVCMDLDVVITGDLTPLWHRIPHSSLTRRYRNGRRGESLIAPPDARKQRRGRWG